ncbi:precorrin-6y C5,15-methyltransferase (decarboxylating) subunit CbiE [Spirulina subsalsa FACHB-351]|uniref:Precorrin-6y C5,15-methyltransferase (Decarboxylating) subunit CbiE n=1 Tax=Spirulina subsalsa FACHB-351 TaxID=234711 RepID=A0ABT3LAY5_9CYAN|nr:precorrin-6y C5,15-methyltransferase (decarboxylating) subunit CbiE [Spirulina subsalsa]MCW6038658.1 precorrin-6y C5,15-methyltransferase (decarboxylating) subunit CbiE [Spirulina subsalsa FACHB-351]
MTTDPAYRSKWLSIVGIGEDGLEGLNPVGRSLLSLASVIVGGERHLAMLPPEDRREKLLWTSPLQDSIQEIIRRRGQGVCVLASGDPMCYGIGVTLTRYIPLEEMTIIPSPSTFSLACSRLGWSLGEVETLSLCGRPPALLHGVLYPGAKLLVLSADAQTPAIASQILTDRGFGESPITVLEHLGGTRERHIQGIANRWDFTDIADLNVIAITCLSSNPLTLPPRLPGLPDSAYQHDGQLTKRQVRAVTLAALAPLPGQLLWDVGAGCGSIGIEWMRCDRRCQSIAIEHHPTRLQYIADNATALGTPHLKIVAGKAPLALQDLPQPDAIFIGGGITTPDLLETCWSALGEGGRLVSNTVTVESELILLQWHRKLGGELIRLSIQKAEPVGKFLGWKAMAPVTQWAVVKGS